MFYTTLESMLARFDEKSRKMRADLSSPSSFLSWQKAAREKLSSLLGLTEISFSDKSPMLIGEKTIEGGIRMEKWLMETEPMVKMPFYLLVPPTADSSTPVFITAPGHMGGGKESLVGNRENEIVAEKIDFYGYDYALYLAKNSYVSLAFDPRGFGERREVWEQDDKTILSSSCREIANMAQSLGLTLCGLLVHDIISIFNLLEEWNRFGEIRALGFSGGGLQTLYASAIDDRIKMSVISGYFYGFKDALLSLAANCSCNYIPSLHLNFDVQDIASLIAPRPLVIQSARGDHLAGKRGLSNVLEPMAELNYAYSLLSSLDKLSHHIVDGPHHFEKNGILEEIEKVCLP
ncbi:MAG: alpha/beta hydrolase family protein [Candidatus Ornithospirochaeta sp.]